MGETLIVRWTNANGSQSIQLLRERLERAFQATVLGRWSVQCRVYHPTHTAPTTDTGVFGATSAVAAAAAVSNDASTPTLTGAAANASKQQIAPGPLYVVQSTASPQHVHAVISGRVVITAGRELEAILTKLRTLWVLRQSAVIEGSTYAMGDLLLRAGILTVGQAHRGLVVELEYMASRRPGQSREGMQRLLRELLPTGATWHTIPVDELVPSPIAAATSSPAPSAEATRQTTPVDTESDISDLAWKPINTRTAPQLAWEELGLSSQQCTPAHAAYLCARLLQRDRLL